jgi:hypothetical protein
MRVLAAGLVALAALAGCASTDTNGWTKPGMTAAQLERDRSDCLLEARQVVPSAEGPRMRLDYPRYQRCMAQRGYTGTAAKN